jgi:hypothetical protein
MRAEFRRDPNAHAFRRRSAAAVTLLAAHTRFPVLGPAPVAGATALDVGGPPPTARR